MQDGYRNGTSPDTWARTTARLLAALAALAVLAAGCGRVSATGTGDVATPGAPERVNTGVNVSDGEPQLGGKLVYGLNAETNGWNPATNQWAPAGLQVMHSIFDTLTAFDDRSVVHPFLAESFEHNDDFTVWTLNLRPGIKLHNGKEVTAETIVRNQNYLKTSLITGQAYTYIDGFAAASPTEVTIKLKEPWVSLPQIWATQIGVVADPDWMESNDGEHPIGTGPFRFENWKIGDELRVTRNADYWQHDAAGRAYPYLDEIDFEVIPDNFSRDLALQRGDLDVMQTPSSTSIIDFTERAKRGDYQVISNSRGETSEVFIQLNNRVAPFDDPDARRALAYATDTKQVVDQTQDGLFEVATGPYAQSSPWYAPSGYPSYDPAKARELVDKVKAEHGSFSFVVIGPSEPLIQQQLQLLEAQWEAVGIDVQVETIEQAKMIIRVVQGDYQATQWQQFDSPDPIDDTVWWTPEFAVDPPTFTLNFARYRNDALIDIFRTFRRSESRSSQREQIAEVQQLMGQDVPYVWLYHSQIAVIGRRDLVNLTNYTLPDGATGLDLVQGAHPLYQVWIERPTSEVATDAGS